MRVLPVLLAAMALAGPALAEKPVPDDKLVYERDTYRYADIHRTVPETTLETCAQACAGEASCAAWSFIPAIYASGPRCELKTAPGAATHRPGVASGMSKDWQMNPTRHGEMRYKPRTYGDPAPVSEPELMGGPGPRVSAIMQPAQPARTPWTERDGAAPVYSVNSTETMPGDDRVSAELGG